MTDALEKLSASLRDEKTIASFFTRFLSTVMPRNHQRVFWGDRMATFDKHAGFLSDPAFLKAYEAIRPSHLYDQYDSPYTVAWRLHTLVWAAKNALALDGDFVECGVFKGDFAWVVMQLTQFTEQKRNFYLYDTFAGFSEKYSSAADYPDNPGFFKVAQEAYTQAGLADEVRARFAPMHNVKVVEGVLPDSLAQDMPEKIAFLHIDINSAKAEIGVLEQLFDRVVPGGMIVFDDYGWYIFRQQKEAEDAFMATRGYHILELPTGQGLVVKR